MPEQDGGHGELELFGFDDPHDRWIDRFRRATAPTPLGAIGPYQILAEVDRGGQGVVYRARQPHLNREIAVKRLRAGSLADAAARQRFEQEMETIASLSHPNILSVFAAELVEGEPILAMEWVEGPTITAWAEGRDARSTVRGFLKVCSAVQHAHRNGIIHRDLKPSNILVDAAGDEPRVLDFGLASVTGATPAEDEGQGFVGTLAYASPEQALGEPVDVRGDVYSLGVVLYRMLTGRMPYPIDDSIETTIATISDVAPARPEGVDPELCSIVLKCLSKSVDDRYPSVEALSDDLLRFLQGAPVAAHSQGPWYLAGKFVRRHRLACLLAGAAAVIIIGLAAGLLVALQSALEANRREADERQVAEQVSSFLTDTLSHAGPYRQGGDMTVTELMQVAAERADVELADRPRVAAELHHTVGTTYANLWMWSDAVRHCERAIELCRAEYGAEHEKVAQSMVVLGRALSNMSDPRSVQVQEDALRIRRALHGDEHHLVAESKMRLGYALYRAARPRRYAEAEAMLDDALATYRRTRGAIHRDVACCLHNYGFLRLVQAREGEAEPLYARALDILDELGDPTDPYYIECLHGYTALLMMLGRYTDSAQRIEELLPLVENAYGHDKLGVLYRRYAHVLLALGEHDAASEYLGRSLEVLCRRHIDDWPDHAAALHRIADLAAASVEDGTLIPPTAPIIESASLGLPPRVEGQLAGALNTYGRNLRLAGYPDDARAVHEQVLEWRMTTTNGAGDQSAAVAMEGLAEHALSSGDHETAQQHLEDALELYDQHVPRLAWLHAPARSKLGLCLARAGEFEAAETLLLESLETLRREFADEHIQARAALQRVITLYELWNRPTDAERYRNETLPPLQGPGAPTIFGNEEPELKEHR